MEFLLVLSAVFSFFFGYAFLGKDQRFFVKNLLGVTGVLLTPFVIGSLPVFLPQMIKELRQTEQEAQLAF